nr:PREDICTED: NACHT, LRR and PYD domains-containing protein 1b allele 3-like isoform X2 [Lepisosteus oculatus]
MSEDDTVKTPPVLPHSSFRPQTRPDGSRVRCSFAFSSRGCYACSITGLRFVMALPAEVQYWTEPFRAEPSLLSSLQPVSPTYNINCPVSEALRLVCFPHSETSPDIWAQLKVAHRLDGNTEIIQPTRVTDSHVEVKVDKLSPFTIVLKILGFKVEVRGQLLLFLLKLSSRQKLIILLLPSNVNVEEVKSKYTGYKFIPTFSNCVLLESTEYSLSCGIEGSTVQPKKHLFFRDYGPNFHGTFEVILSQEVKELELELFRSKSKELRVWSGKVLLEDAVEVAAPPAARAGGHFVDRHFTELVSRVTVVDPILDSLLQKNLITLEGYIKIRSRDTPSEKMRELLLGPMVSSGDRGKDELLRILAKEFPCLMADLKGQAFP